MFVKHQCPPQQQIQNWPWPWPTCQADHFNIDVNQCTNFEAYACGKAFSSYRLHKFEVHQRTYAKQYAPPSPKGGLNILYPSWLLTSLPRSPREISPVFTSCYLHHFPDRPVRYRLSSRAVTYITSQIAPCDIACLHELLLTSLPRSPREISPVFTSCYLHRFPDRPVRYRLSSRVVTYITTQISPWDIACLHELLLTSLPRSPREISPVFTSCYLHHFPNRPVRYRLSSRAVTYITSQIAPWDIACLHELLLTSLPRSPREISPVFTSCYLHHFPDRPVRYRLSSRVVTYITTLISPWDIACLHELLLTSLPRSPREISPVFTSCYLHHFPDRPRDIACLHELLLTSLPKSPRAISPVFTSCYLHHFPDRPVRYRLSSRAPHPMFRRHLIFCDEWQNIQECN